MSLILNGNTFEHGDEVTVITDYCGIVLHGKISIIPDDTYYYICHNNDGIKGGVLNDKQGYKYCLSYYSLYGNLTILHRIDIESLNNEDYIEKSIISFIKDMGISFDQKMSHLLDLNLGIIDGYDSIIQSDKQGYVDLHSSTRGKKLSIKFNRLIRKLSTKYNDKVLSNKKNTPYKIIDAQIEEIHNRWMASDSSLFTSEIVSGKKIEIGYTKSNYSPNERQSGTLNKSCMIDKFDFIKLYTDNPDKISLMIFYDNEHRIAGRCLLWNCDDGKKYYDRIYYVYDWYEYAFTKIVESQGYEKIYQTENPNKVTLKKIDHNNYPYLDTFYGVSFKKRALYFNTDDKYKIKYEFRGISGQIREKTDVTDAEAE